MEIYHVLGNLNRGGAETLVINLHQKLENEVTFNYIVHGKNAGDYETKVKEMGGEIYHVPKFKFYNFISYITSLNSLFKKLNEKSIIHVHVRSTSKIITYIARRNGLKVVLHSHSDSNEKSLKGLLTNIIQSNGADADLRIACSKKSGEWMYKGNNFEVLHNSIDIHKYKFNKVSRLEIREKYNVREDNLLLGHVGNRIEAKNHEFILRLSEDMKDIEGVKFMLVGRGVTDLAIDNQNLNDNVILIETVENIEDFYSAFDLLIMPSIREGFPMVLIEAQANGLQVMASNNISKETDVSGKIQFIDLEVDKWREKILKININEDDRLLSESELIKLSKYDTTNVIVDLVNSYNKIITGE